jgi:DNA-binding MarR family transcriptional regulator
MEDRINNYFTTLRRFSHILLNKLASDDSETSCDLKLSQLKAIAAFKDDRAFSMNELAKSGMIKLPNMTTMVDSLINDGIAERERDESDRRRVLVRLTPKGREIRTKFLANRRKTATAIFSSLSEKKKNELLDSLEKVCTILEETIMPDESH